MSVLHARLNELWKGQEISFRISRAAPPRRTLTVQIGDLVSTLPRHPRRASAVRLPRSTTGCPHRVPPPCERDDPPAFHRNLSVGWLRCESLSLSARRTPSYKHRTCMCRCQTPSRHALANAMGVVLGGGRCYTPPPLRRVRLHMCAVYLAQRRAGLPHTGVLRSHFAHPVLRSG